MSGGVVEFPLTGFEGREATAVICAGGAVGDLNFCDSHGTVHTLYPYRNADCGGKSK